ncbi:hypothetical protein GCK72_026229 [Caenorhabditis remanei]|uniref:Uncharacterized protein n=1 Tax=Caenorhabditis remanei TaxID=31234 RepID=A0A6A5G493_CAERE|nr:hypothetical protein GCK72_026229 [Caenorhabditis remanei]KAF1749760.1 hypothetical protein GCK72_026229 [Caenorhabditis remanei]
MAITRWDMSKASESEKKSTENGDSMTLNEIVHDLAKKNPFLKTPMKCRREEKEEVSAGEKRLEWLKEKAKKAVIPTEQVSTLKPEHIFLENGPLIIHMCLECKKFNSTRTVTNLGEGKIQLPLGLCTICRSHINRQRAVKFFEHELPSIKTAYDL